MPQTCQVVRLTRCRFPRKEWVQQHFADCQPLRGVPLQQLAYEVDALIWPLLKLVFEVVASIIAEFSDCLVLLKFEILRPLMLLLRLPDEGTDLNKLVYLVLPRHHRRPCVEQLRNDAAERPHIAWEAVGGASKSKN
jgi:hypothetical protein